MAEEPDPAPPEPPKPPEPVASDGADEDGAGCGIFGAVVGIALFLFIGNTIRSCVDPGNSDSNDSGSISEATFDDEWPFTVSEGVVRCEGGSSVVFVTGGETYAINGSARGRADEKGWSDLNEIWLPNPEIDGTKINIGPVISVGLGLC